MTSGQTQGSFNGVLDEARIWNYARSAQQINHGRTLEISSSAPGLLGRWGLNDGSGTVVGDSSGHAITGTAVGTITWVAGAPFPGPANTAPVATTDSATTAENSAAIAIAVLANDTDADSDALTVTSVGVPGHGTASINPNGTVAYTPAANYFGSDSFTYTISDGQGGSATATVNVTVTRVNHAPVAVNDSYSTNKNVTLSIDAPGVLANDTDADAGDALSAIWVSGPAHGTLTTFNAEGSFTYTPIGGYAGPDSFTYKANDNTADSNVATVTITVIAVNSAPIAVNGTLTTLEDTPASGTLVATDVDGDALTYAIVANGTKGTAAITNVATGAFTYTPNANANGTDTITFKARDGALDSNTATVSITITPVNDAPVAVDDTATTAEDTAVDIAVVSNVRQRLAQATLQAVAGSIAGVHGGTAQLQADGRTVRFTPAANANGGNTPGGFGFSYKVTDGSLPSALAATVTITVTAVNDAPVAAAGTLTTLEDTPATGTLVATDVDGDALTYAIVTNGTKGTAAITNATTGAFTYTPNPNATGADTITFKAHDALVDSNTATVSITITPVNDAPVAVNGTLTTVEDTPASGTLVATDIDSGTLTYAIVTNGTKGTASLNAATGAFTYTPNANANGPDSFRFKANDGTADSTPATVSITITAVNDAPVAVDDTATTPEDTAVDIAVVSNDTDIDTAQATLQVVAGSIAGVHGGTAALQADGRTVRFTPDPNANGGNTPGGFGFTYKVTDGSLTAALEATVAITVTAVNDAPVAANGTLTTLEDTPASGTLVATDVDGDTLTYSIVTNGTKGTATVTNAVTGAFTYTPNANANGTDSFTYKANDGTANSNVSTVNLTIAAVNDAPVANNDSFSTPEDTTVVVVAPGLLGNDTDVDGDLLTAILLSNPIHGTLTLNTNGSVTYTPFANYNGPDSFTYKASDGVLDSNVATVTITVNAVNDAPVAANDSYSTNEDTTLTVAAPGRARQRHRRRWQPADRHCRQRPSAWRVDAGRERQRHLHTDRQLQRTRQLHLQGPRRRRRLERRDREPHGHRRERRARGRQRQLQHH